ncbi:hypothetical protein [uncultured Thiohalocapsa sp.]|uniref:hypothetical protein n=1 Tax=uncultured Thiohalocapsa sp. TaxID=768990 RepID=UPI0025FE364B|nr:hypothetical protein [uncultured Thiohalocapsa sp.]
MADQQQPPQHQARQPGREGEMRPQPEYIRESYRGSDKLRGRAAIVTGGDSGIGRAPARTALTCRGRCCTPMAASW